MLGNYGLFLRSGAGARKKFFVLPALIFFSAVWIVSPAFAQTKSSSATISHSAKKEKAVYQLVELPLRALAISNSGWVAGITPDQKAALWSAAKGLEVIPLPEGFASAENISVNSEGEAAGTVTSADSRQRAAFLYRDGKIALLPGEQASANAINDAGEIVGQAKIPGAKTIGPVLWKKGFDGNLEIIDFKICCAGVAKGINNRSEIIGDTYDEQGRYHAFIWDAAHGSRLLHAPGEEFSSAITINELGEYVERQTPGGFLVYAKSGTVTVDARESTPHSLNRDGLVVGSVGSDPEKQRAFVWDKAHGMRDLNAITAHEKEFSAHAKDSAKKDSDDSDWELEVATAINDRGEIVGWGDHEGAENAGFLLRPIVKTTPKANPRPKAETK
jgi:uncharacterized membrane protein